MMGKRRKVWSKEYIEKIVDGEDDDVEEEFVSPRKNYHNKKKAEFDKSTWSIPEKALLLEGLKQYGFNNLDKVSDHIKTKGVNDIRQHLKNRRALLIRKHNKERKDYNKPKKRTIIQSWYEIASSEVPSRHKRDDISWIFSEMFSNAAKNEPHLKPRTDSDPDIAAINQYFADILSGVFPADLRPIDSTIVLSLLHSLGNIIYKGNFNLEKEMYSKFKGTKGNGSLLSPLSINSNTNNDLNSNTNNDLNSDTNNDFNSNKKNSNEIKAKDTTAKCNINKESNGDSIVTPDTTNKVNKDSSSFNQIDDVNGKDKADSNSINKLDDTNEMDKDDSGSVILFYSNVENEDHGQNTSTITEDSDTDRVNHDTSDIIVASENENDETDKIADNDSSAMNEDNDSNIVQMQIECNPDSIDSNHSEFKGSDLNDYHDPWKKFQLNDPNNVKLAKKYRRVIQLLNPLHVPPCLMQMEHEVFKQFQ